ncbi:MAG: M20/M25/M40 family metallo-hydrolase [Anaerolineae bacterium]|jgi:acetylornithine deacetylase/succinyl-diaminopimelate desuccinylase-like protein|nr:MAG: M20/M25/M40 family metallo-hydrolase [Anaerolineae bacterium]MCL4880222.1 M20/M25/M40 family metallo-hydrolase [Anaerolineae bacterium]
MSLSNASIVRLTNSAILKNARDAINKDDIINSAIRIQQIAAPTFAEQARAEYIQSLFRQLDLENVEMDDVYNVYGWLPGEYADAPALLISAHTDTVFPIETNLAVRNEGEQIYGPGLGDNSLGVAALLGLIEIFKNTGIPHEANLCFVANSREEGLGDLGGMRGVIQKLRDKVKAVIVLEGMALGRIYHAGIGVRRYKLTVTCPGGHSWLHFGGSSAIHSLMQFGSDLCKIEVPSVPRTTYNIGVIGGGTSVNTIASEAFCYIDLRSEDVESLQNLEQDVMSIADRLAREDVNFHFELVGNRPAGAIPIDHPLVRLAVDAHEAIQMKTELDGGSTDANIPLSEGIPTVCVGVSYGGNAHRLDEYIETAPIELGMWQLMLLTTAASNAISTW